MSSDTTEMVYQFIVQYRDTYGISPSQREIAEGCYIVRSAVPRHLDKLEARGRIARAPGQARTIHLTKKQGL
jgi:DNA-binding MarR family transcriptional regulator